MIKLVFLRDDVTQSGMRCGEEAAFALNVAAKLIARGVATLAVGETGSEELSCAVAQARQPRTGRWEMPLVAAHHRWRFEG